MIFQERVPQLRKIKSPILKTETLYSFEKKYKPDNVHDLRFVAPFVNQIWHTNLHYFKRKEGEDQRYLISFIDDRSRKILYFEVLDDKTDESAFTVIKKVIDLVIADTNHVPHIIVTDNGYEFVNDASVSVINQYQVKQFRIHSYTFEENAKIERFWRTYEQAKTDNSTIGEIADEYNMYWLHKDLYMMNRKKMTPHKAWKMMPKYDG